ALARGFARRGCQVVGLDPAEALLEEAKRLDGAAGVTIRYLRARAEQTGLSAGSFEVVTAGQCWHWFERSRVAAGMRRLLAPEASDGAWGQGLDRRPAGWSTCW
ncbi:unnamed protein product, partial [marine sediment metagenome]